MSYVGNVGHFWNFGTPLISRERSKLKTWNLAERWILVCNNEKIQSSYKWGYLGVTRPTFENLGLPNISGTVSARNFNLARRWTALTTKCIPMSQGVMRGSRYPFSEFWDPLISRKRIKLDISNLAYRWLAVSNNKKKQNSIRKGHAGVTIKSDRKG